MSVTKSDIVKNIAFMTSLNKQNSKKIFESFIFLITNNSAHSIVKLNKFGTFKRRVTPSRVGRNPKSKEIYKITKRNKLFFSSSTFIKDTFN